MLSYIWVIIGLGIMLWGSTPYWYYGSIHIGIHGTSFLGLYLLFYALSQRDDWFIGITLGKIVLPIVFGLVVGFFIFFVRVHMIVKKHRATKRQRGTVVVLGFYIEDDQPSMMLQRRLDGAWNHLRENRENHCILTGGQGPNEHYPESLVMENYLKRKQITPERLWREEQSHNTLDNLLYAKEIILLRQLNQKMIIVSDYFHLYRAYLEANKLGTPCKLLPVSTPIVFALSYWVREYFAVLRYYWRSWRRA